MSKTPAEIGPADLHNLLRSNQDCPDCFGHGGQSEGENDFGEEIWTDCERCNGTGKV